jgi:hypothetical protein
MARVSGQQEGRGTPGPLANPSGSALSRCLMPRSGYLPPYSPIWCHRVEAASSEAVLPLWKTAAFASGATAADRLRAATAARNRFFIGTLVSLHSDGMSGFDERPDGQCRRRQNGALHHADMQRMNGDGAAGVVHFWPFWGNKRARGNGRPLRVGSRSTGLLCGGGGQPPWFRRAGSEAVRGPAASANADGFRRSSIRPELTRFRRADDPPGGKALEFAW